jgi:ABC-type sugar transport system substrate-binding protein
MKSSLKFLGPILGIALVAAVLAGWSSTRSSASAQPRSARSSALKASSAQPPVGTASELAATIKQAYGTSVSPSTIPKVILQALEVASAPITPALEAKFKQCMTEPICTTGHGTITIGIAEPTAADLGNLDNRAGWTLQALRYPQVKKIIFTNANGDTATAISNFRSLISQGANVITGLFSAGSALLSVAKQATAAGIKVVEYTEPIPGAVPGKDVLTFLGTNICSYGTAVAKAAYTASGDKKGGSMALLTGPAGNPYGATWMPCAEKQLTAQGWTLALTGNTNWDEQGEAQEASAIIASGKDPTAIGYDYTPQAIIDAYVQAGKKPPIMIAGAGTAGYFSSIAAAKAKGYTFPAYISNSQAWLTAPSITAGIQALQGQKIDPNVLIPDLVVPAKNLDDQYSKSQNAEQQMNILLPISLENWVASTSS